MFALQVSQPAFGPPFLPAGDRLPAKTPDANAESDLTELVHHREGVQSTLAMEDVHKAFQSSTRDFFAILEGERVVGLCSRATVGFMLGSRYGFALYGGTPVWSARAPRPLIYPVGASIRQVLDETFSRTGSEFFEDIVLVDDDGKLIGLVPVPSLASLQTRLFGEQLKVVVAQDEELRQQNLELFQVNHQLRQSQGRYKALFENNALGVALLDTNGGIVAHNRRFELLLRLSDRPEPANFQLEQWVSESDRFALRRLLMEHERLSLSTEPCVAELHFDFPEGPRLFELHTSWVAETGQICVFLEDITDQRSMEQSLARQEKQNMLDTLVAGVAHELNNKLTPVLGFADLLQAVAPQNLHAHTRCIQQSAQEAAQIIRQLLSLSRPSGQPHDLLDLAGVCREALQMLRFQLREAGCEVSLHLPPKPAHVHGDAAQLKQVLINLALNSLHAMEGRPETKLIVSVAIEQGQVWLRVRDFGSGIKPENLSRIFDPFFTTKGPRGTGLGLSISASIIRQHGGEISVESAVGQGSTFSIQLPATSSSALPASMAPKATSSLSPVTPETSRCRILVVDDEEFVRQFMQEALRLCFTCSVDTAADGAEAIDQLLAYRYDLILSDIRMPRLDGLQLRRWLNENQPEMSRRLIFVTGHAGAVDIDQSLGLLPCPVIRKPFTIDSISSTCRTVLQRAEEAAGTKDAR